MPALKTNVFQMRVDDEFLTMLDAIRREYEGAIPSRAKVLRDLVAARFEADEKAAAKKRATPNKKSAAKTGAAAATEKTTSEVAEPKKIDRPKGSVSSMDVTLGHIFSIRPRVNTGFRQNHLLEATRALIDEVFADLREAARAVAEEALVITRGGAARPEKHRRR